ncbi:hypothetical protein [Thioclava pacifica]|uniref:Uncharacterized protein n=1 Tax=Thioclava pacifica DSM 10166 TaxID=1353537 RepID=A0A074J4F4_9RHOB|nr:hypothetical protein [Thioclava pacifica]KEO50795.1 hypothetical protein TP2_14300 [Thioclava pacifica DSM 10166]
MRPELTTRRRALRLAFERYIEADRAWRMAIRGLNDWFPKGAPLHSGMIGNPGSRVRRLFDARSRALLHFEIAQVKMTTAKQRLAERSNRNVRRVLLIGPPGQ